MVWNGSWKAGAAAVAVMVLLVSLAGCLGGGEGRLIQTGSSTVLPLAIAWAEEFEGAQVSVSGGGSTHGLNALLNGEADLADAIDDFSTETKSDTDEIDTTLQDLAKLDDIIYEVEKVESDLAQAKMEIEDDVQTTHEEQMSRSTVNMALIAVVFVLLLIVLVLMFQNRKMAADVPPPPREEEDMVILEDI